jgi:chemotaxis response regulator CheB
VIVHRPTADALVLSSLSGRALAIATRGAGQDGWRPFLQIESDAPQLRLRPLSGAAITCSPG